MFSHQNSLRDGIHRAMPAGHVCRRHPSRQTRRLPHSSCEIIMTLIGPTERGRSSPVPGSRPSSAHDGTRRHRDRGDLAHVPLLLSGVSAYVAASGEPIDDEDMFASLEPCGSCDVHLPLSECSKYRPRNTGPTYHLCTVDVDQGQQLLDQGDGLDHPPLRCSLGGWCPRASGLVFLTRIGISFCIAGSTERGGAPWHRSRLHHLECVYHQHPGIMIGDRRHHPIDIGPDRDLVGIVRHR